MPTSDHVERNPMGWHGRDGYVAHWFGFGDSVSRCGLVSRYECEPREDGKRCGSCERKLNRPVRTHTYVQALNTAIFQARTRKGMSLVRLAKKSGVSFNTLRNMQSARTREHWPSTQTVHHIAVALGLAPSTLMQWAEELQRGEVGKQ